MKKTKKVLALALALALTGCLASCGTSSGTSSTSSTSSTASTSSASTSSASSVTTAPVELTVLAAASMTETLNQVIANYEKANSNVKITATYDSSGTLKTQIEEGADCDLFISAGQKQMNQLDANDTTGTNTDKLDFVLSDSRVNILENKVTLCVPSDNPKNIKSFADMAAGLTSGSILLGMGNSDVPVGQYTQKILTYYKLDETALANAGNITYGSNVKEVTTQITEGTVDCGVIYCTDAYSAGLTIVDYATSDMCGQVIYPAAVMKNSKNQDAAKAFLKYLTSDESMKIFEAVGFSAVK